MRDIRFTTKIRQPLEDFVYIRFTTKIRQPLEDYNDSCENKGPFVYFEAWEVSESSRPWPRRDYQSQAGNSDFCRYDKRILEARYVNGVSLNYLIHRDGWKLVGPWNPIYHGEGFCRVTAGGLLPTFDGSSGKEPTVWKWGKEDSKKLLEPIVKSTVSILNECCEGSEKSKIEFETNSQGGS